MKQTLFAALFAAFVCVSHAQVPVAAKLNVSWTNSPSPSLTVTNIYVSKTPVSVTTGKFASPTSFQVPATTTAFSSTTLPDDTYYVAVTAVNAAGLESVYSNIFQITILSSPPLPPTGLKIVAQTATLQKSAAVIKWDTNVVSRGKVLLYGAKSNTLLDSEVVTKTGLSHSVRFAGLKRGRTYKYQIVTKDAAGIVGPSSDLMEFTL